MTTIAESDARSLLFVRLARLDADLLREARRGVAMCFGPEDFATAMGIDPHVDGMTTPAQTVAIAAVAAGIEPLGVPGTVADSSDLYADRTLAMHARRIGMRGAVCIHPGPVSA